MIKNNAKCIDTHSKECDNSTNKQTNKQTNKGILYLAKGGAVI